jgi:signal transduction histidine kinase
MRPTIADFSLTWTGSPELTLWADRTRLRQVVANLIENAVKLHRAGRQGFD